MDIEGIRLCRMPFFVSLNMQDGFSFPKNEKVVSKYDIDLLFGKTRTAREGVIFLKATWREAQAGEPPVKVLIIVPKRRMKLAVRRNRIKRQLREVYRLNKFQVDSFSEGKTLLLAILFQGTAMPDYSDLESQYLKAKASLLRKIGKA